MGDYLVKVLELISGKALVSHKSYYDLVRDDPAAAAQAW